MPRMYNWDLYYSELAEMYLLHNMYLKDIMTEMSTRYNFSPRSVNSNHCSGFKTNLKIVSGHIG